MPQSGRQLHRMGVCKAKWSLLCLLAMAPGASPLLSHMQQPEGAAADTATPCWPTAKHWHALQQSWVVWPDHPTL